MAAPPLARDEADRVLADLGAARDRLAASMYALDSHPAVAFLRGAALAGRTRRRWEELEPRLTALWAHFSVVGDLLEAARGVRARRSRLGDDDLAELGALLREPVIALDADGLPADGTGKPVARRIGLVDLVPKLAADSAALVADLSTVDSAAAAVAAALAEPTEAVERATRRAAELGADGLAGTVADLAGRIGAVRDRALSDPLALAPDGTVSPDLAATLDGLGGELSAVRSRLADLDTLRADYAGRRDRLVALLSTVDDAEAAARSAYATVTEKIADPGLPAAPDAAVALRTRLDELDRLHRAGAWGPLAATFVAAERDAAAAGRRAGELRAAADGLLARRDELRGRLDAYRAKAARLGHLEDPGLSARHGEARDLLYTAPCELPAATRAVFAYQQALAELATPRKGPV